MSDKSDGLDTQDKSKKNLIFAVIVLIVLAAVVVFILFKPTEPEPVRQPAHVTAQKSVNEYKPAPVAEPEPIKEPEQVNEEPKVNVPPKPIEKAPEPVVNPLPTLDESDSNVYAKINEYLPDTAMSLLVNDDMIRRGVVYIDNLAQGKLAKKHNPIVQPEESFSVREGEILTIDPNSYERYTPYVKIFTSMSSAQIVRLYNEYTPLINEAYSEIGYGENEFNNTLIDAIDLLLDTPEPKGALPLLRDSVTYQYAFSEWELLPDAQKQLLRTGPENMKQIKSVLMRVKQELEKQ
ncbi:DUF3014 domain-containing protein [Pseudoalteromonas sp. MMG010]|uniref:DUF3014 domain-containing protein n=1 Tax=Pseudoalteromonas sp. MMG010 TaxID=2822685 RepID=UPI001B3A0242|nr:DUF3014 domain-containing protein [Pseudoalteromonas sp. MMG010]MBQ4832987.1 DUF3014 domain-containing protein [Pseudoalteromonas sp. MMG010]